VHFAGGRDLLVALPVTGLSCKRFLADMPLNVLSVERLSIPARQEEFSR